MCVSVCECVLTTVGCGCSSGMAPFTPDPGFARAVDAHRVTANLEKDATLYKHMD